MTCQFLNYIPTGDVEKIHEAALSILERFGVKIEDPALRKNLTEHGCRENGERIVFKRDIIENMISAKKPYLKLRSTNGGQDVTLEDGQIRSHSTGGLPWVLDIETGKGRNARYSDLVDSIHLMNALSNVDVPCSLVYPEDVPHHITQLTQLATMLKQSKKPIYGPGISSSEEAKFAVELFHLYSGGKMQKAPIGCIGLSPESPLLYPKNITDSLVCLVAGGVPVSMLIAPVGGFSSPVSMAGAMAQLHAEMLGFAYIAHTVNPNTVVLYGARQFFANMKNGQVIAGLPEVGICSAVAAQLARRANMISDLYGLSCTSGCFDSQAGYEKAINTLLPAIAGAHFISGIGSLGSLMVASLTQMLIDDEIFAMVKRVYRGFEVNADTLALEVLDKVINNGKKFIEQPHTVKQLRAGAVFHPNFSFGASWGDWLKEGEKSIGTTAAEKVKEILAQAESPEIDPKINLEADLIIKKATEKLAR